MSGTTSLIFDANGASTDENALILAPHRCLLIRATCQTSVQARLLAAVVNGDELQADDLIEYGAFISGPERLTA